MNDWNELKRDLFEEATTCQVWRGENECGKPAVDLDHAIFGGRQKRKRVSTKQRNWLNSLHNAQRACGDCNRWLRAADQYDSIEGHIRRELEQHPGQFIEWFRTPQISTVPGSKYHEIERIVKEYANEYDKSRR